MHQLDKVASLCSIRYPKILISHMHCCQRHQ